LADLHEQIVVKLPMTKEGVMATIISDRGKTNVLVFSAGHDCEVAKAGVLPMCHLL
jgi:transaldolase